MTQNALVAWPYSGRGCARSSARPCTCASAAAGGYQRGTPSNRRHRSCASRRARRLNRVHGSLEERSESCRDEILVEERHLVVAGVALGSNEPGRRVDRQPLRGQQLAHARVVGHLREGAGVRPASPATARTTVMGRLVRVVETDRSMSDHQHERREAIANADVFDDAADDICHLPYGEPEMLPDRRRVVLAIQLQTGSPRRDRGLLDPAPS